MASPNTKKSREFELLIADAQRQFDVNGKVQHMSFWAFKVMCRSFLPSYQNPPLFPDVVTAPNPSTTGKAPNFINSGAGYVDYCSWHRYSDFEWLVEQVECDSLGLIVPPLPPKENDATKDKVQDLVSSKENDNPKLIPFVQTRIRHLNMWAQVIMDMTELHDSPHLKAFIAMEEPQWLVYREKVNASRKGTGVAAVAGRISNFFGKISNRNVVVYDDVCEFGQIRLHQLQMAESLRMCQYRMKDMENLALNQPKELSDLSSQFVVNSSKPLVYPLITNGHFVARGEKRGVVRHVDQQNYVYVEWTTRDSFGNQVPNGEGLERLSINELSYPESGISDPAVFACVEAASQVESFFAYIQHRSESRDLEKLIDLLWFWRAYCEKIGVTIKNLSEIEIKRQDAAKDAAGIKDAAKKQVKLDEAELLASRFTAGEQTFKRFYATLFRPLQKTGLFNINMLVGRVSYNLLNDDDWPNRLMRCDKALNPDFDTPAEVTAMLQALARGEAPPATIARPTGSTTKISPTTSSPPASSPKNKAGSNFAAASDSDSEDEEAARRRARAEAKAARKLEKERARQAEEAAESSQQRSESVAPAHDSD